MTQKFIYQESSQTIRLMPYNFMIAKWDSGGCLCYMPDLGVDTDLATRCFTVAHSYAFRWEDPKEAVRSLNDILFHEGASS
jgi:hypothetical protein